MVKRTSMLIDPDLVFDAARELGTEGTTATVRAALEQTVRQAKLKRLSEWEFPDDAVEQLAEMRRPSRWVSDEFLNS